MSDQPKVRKSGVVNPRQYIACVNCGRPARKYPGGHNRCRACYDLARLPEHGTESRYSRGCKCDSCRAAAATARRSRRHANPEAARTYDREYKERSRA